MTSAALPNGGAGASADDRIELLGLDDPRWTDFVATCADASPFHHPAWAKLIGDSYGHATSGIALIDAAGAITCGVPAVEIKGVARKHRWVALPYTDHCDILSPGARETTAFVQAFAALSERTEAPPIEIRAELLDPEVLTSIVGVRHTLALSTDSSEVFRSFKRTQVQQPIVKAQKEGVVVRFADSWETTADTFYRLHVSTRRRLGTPVQPKRYFRLLWERLVEPGLGFVLVAYAGERAAAAAVFLKWNDTVIYKYSASDPDLWKLRPNNLLLWNAIQWGSDNGYKLFDFGRTDLDNEGLRAFKRGWGTTETDLVYSVIGGPQVERSAGGAMKLARPMIQRMPDWFCRAVGEVAYRYAT